MLSKDDILAAYNFRYACKVYDPSRKVSDADLRFILETGRLSPSSFGLEPWRFVVMNNPEILHHISETAWGVGKKALDATLVLILSRKGSTLHEDGAYFRHLSQDVKQLPPDIDQAVSSFFKNFRENDFNLMASEQAFDDWAARQCYIALGNMLTSAAMIGIDSTPLEGFPRAAMTDYLVQKGVFSREEFNLAVMAAFGYRAGEPQRAKTRQDYADVVEIFS